VTSAPSLPRQPTVPVSATYSPFFHAFEVTFSRTVVSPPSVPGYVYGENGVYHQLGVEDVIEDGRLRTYTEDDEYSTLPPSVTWDGVPPGFLDIDGEPVPAFVDFPVTVG
jgi:hypothetical protein